MLAVPTVAAASDAANPEQHRKLTAAAQQFEAMFLEQMMKPFNSSDEDGNATGEEQIAGSGTYQSLGVEAMASAVSHAGGFGIARSVVASIERQTKGRLDEQQT